MAPARVQFFPNWVDVSAVQPMGRPSLYRQTLGLAEGQVVALFSGTLGAKQGLHLIAEAARLLVQRCPQVMFVICGSGVMEPTLRAGRPLGGEMDDDEVVATAPKGGMGA